MFRFNTIRELTGGTLSVFNVSISLALLEGLLISVPYGMFYLILLEILSPAPDFATQLLYLGVCVLAYVVRFFCRAQIIH